MTLEEAKSTIIHTLSRMNAVYAPALFDEWVLVSLRNNGGAILAYDGPRAESYQRQFVADIQPLRTVVARRVQSVGDFEFAPEAGGTRYDACLKTGAASFLFCNNTRKSMTELRQDPMWLEAQKSFVQLSAKFMADPLE